MVQPHALPSTKGNAAGSGFPSATCAARLEREPHLLDRASYRESGAFAGRQPWPRAESSKHRCSHNSSLLGRKRRGNWRI